AGGKAVLRWKAAATAYRIFRSEGDLPWRADDRPVATVQGTTWTDAGLERGTIYHYAVRSLDGDGTASAASVKVRTQPRVVEDAVVSVLSVKEVRLTWKAPDAADVAGYHVERAVVEVFSEDEILRLKKDTPPLPEPSIGAIRAIGAFTRVTAAPVPGREYSDT